MNYPNNTEIESLVLLSIFMSEENLLNVLETCKEEDFYNANHRMIFSVINDCNKRGISVDKATVNNYINSEPIREVFNNLFLITDYKNENIPQYIDILVDLSTKRSVLDASLNIQRLVNSNDITANNLIESSEILLLNAIQRDNSNDISLIGESITEIANEIQQDPETVERGIISGVEGIDKLTNGFFGSELIIVAGRPSMGKTAFALQAAINAALNEKNVLMFSIEQPKKEIIYRMLANLGRLSLSKIKNRVLNSHEISRLTQAVDRIKYMPFFIDENPNLGIVSLIAKAKKLHRQEDSLGLIVLDYIQLMNLSTTNVVREIGDISKSLKLLARTLDVPVIALSQLSRNCEQREDKRPMLSDLRESGAIEQDGDKIIFMYSDYPYTKRDEDLYKSEIILGKNRNGPVGKALVTYNKITQQFFDRDHVSPDSIGYSEYQEINVSTNEDEDFF